MPKGYSVTNPLIVCGASCIPILKELIDCIFPGDKNV